MINKTKSNSTDRDGLGVCMCILDVFVYFCVAVSAYFPLAPENFVELAAVGRIKLLTDWILLLLLIVAGGVDRRAVILAAALLMLLLLPLLFPL